MNQKAVFVDVSGRRRLRLRWAGIAVGVLLGGYLSVVLAGMVLGVSVPYTAWPTDEDHRPNGTTQNGSLHQVGADRTPSPGPNVSPARNPGTGGTPQPAGSTSANPAVRPTSAPTGAATAVPNPASTKTKGNSINAPGRSKSPSPHGHG